MNREALTENFKALAGVEARFPGLRESVSSMSANGWYKQTFRGGEEVYFKALTQQKNGGWKGLIVRYGDNGKPKKGVQMSVLKNEFRLWNEIPEREVPGDVLARV